MKPRALLARLARGELANVSFPDAERLAEALGFTLDRVAGSHHIYRHPDVTDRLNLQPSRSGDAKPYQLRQLLQLAERGPDLLLRPRVHSRGSALGGPRGSAGMARIGPSSRRSHPAEALSASHLRRRLKVAEGRREPSVDAQTGRSRRPGSGGGQE